MVSDAVAGHHEQPGLIARRCGNVTEPAPRDSEHLGDDVVGSIWGYPAPDIAGDLLVPSDIEGLERSRAGFTTALRPHVLLHSRKFMPEYRRAVPESVTARRPAGQTRSIPHLAQGMPSGGSYRWSAPVPTMVLHS